ncbi:hypothetical protein NDU88_006639 [Pleurodeles waltl]|uniref:Secreted protein n=1 Tax=Pleurodeles waltl TaxID=8319 RepID=A0AAV7PMF8_PLEWA|nr:hypothetical protein NDU88_006639 [Pleurodeles waltl]
MPLSFLFLRSRFIARAFSAELPSVLHILALCSSLVSTVPERPHATFLRRAATPWAYSERSRSVPQSRSETPRYSETSPTSTWCRSETPLQCADTTIPDV